MKVPTELTFAAATIGGKDVNPVAPVGPVGPVGPVRPRRPRLPRSPSPSPHSQSPQLQLFGKQHPPKMVDMDQPTIFQLTDSRSKKLTMSHGFSRLPRRAKIIEANVARGARRSRRSRGSRRAGRAGRSRRSSARTRRSRGTRIIVVTITSATPPLATLSTFTIAVAVGDTAVEIGHVRTPPRGSGQFFGLCQRPHRRIASGSGTSLRCFVKLSISSATRF